MAVIFIGEFWQRDGDLDNKGVRNYKRTIRARTTDPRDGALTVGQAISRQARIAIGDPYIEQNGTIDAGALCTKISTTQDQDDPNTWLVTIDYSSAIDNREDQKSPNPTDHTPDISFNTVNSTRHEEVDIFGTKYTNSAGVLFQGGREVEDNIVQITISESRSSFDYLRTVTEFKNRVNTEPFLGFEPGFLRLHDVSASIKVENGFPYWRITWIFQYRGGYIPAEASILDASDGNPLSLEAIAGWEPVLVLDKGTHIYDTDLGKYVPITKNAYGEDTSEPQLLDGANGQLGRDEAPVYFAFYFYEGADFNELIGITKVPMTESPTSSKAPASIIARGAGGAGTGGIQETGFGPGF